MNKQLFFFLTLILCCTTNLSAQINPELEIQSKSLEFSSDQGQSFYIQRDSNSLMIGNDSLANLLSIKYINMDSVMVNVNGNLNLTGNLMDNDSLNLIVISDDLAGIKLEDETLLLLDSIGLISRSIKIGDINMSYDELKLLIQPGGDDDEFLHFMRDDTLLASMGTNGLRSDQGFLLSDSLRLEASAAEEILIMAGVDTLLSLDTVGLITRSYRVKSYNSGRSEVDQRIEPGGDDDEFLNFMRGDTLLASMGTNGLRSDQGFLLSDSVRIQALSNSQAGFYHGDSILLSLDFVLEKIITSGTLQSSKHVLGTEILDQNNHSIVPGGNSNELLNFMKGDSLVATFSTSGILLDSNLVLGGNMIATGDVRGGKVEIVLDLHMDADGSPGNIFGLDSIILDPNSNWGFALSTDLDNDLQVGSDGNLFLETAVATLLQDGDSNTQIQVEESLNEDLIRFDIAGTERMHLDSNTLHLNPPGIGNTFIGEDAGKNNTPVGANDGQNNTALGVNALFANTIGNQNTAIGNNALHQSTIGNANTAVGTHALFNNTTGTENTAVGGGVMSSNTTGSFNVAIGRAALNSNNTGSLNTAIGRLSLLNNSGGSRNIAIGESALSSNETGGNNTANGYEALYDNTTGSSNTAMGYDALRTNATGNNNTAIGRNADVLSNNLTNAAAIGYNAKVATSNSMVLGGTGGNAVNVGINTDSPTERLHVVGNICYTGTSAACSDRRYKENFQAINGALASLRQLNGQYYHWKQADFPSLEFGKERQIGLIAQEVEAFFPEIVTTNSAGYKAVDYSRFSPILLEAVKELANQTEQQQAEIQELKRQNELLKQQLGEVAELRRMVLEMQASSN